MAVTDSGATDAVDDEGSVAADWLFDIVGVADVENSSDTKVTLMTLATTRPPLASDGLDTAVSAIGFETATAFSTPPAFGWYGRTVVTPTSESAATCVAALPTADGI